MKEQTKIKLNDLIETYSRVMGVMEHDAARAMEEDGRAYGGFIRAAKGKMQEFISEQIVRIAWCVELEKKPNRLAINSKKIRIPINKLYVQDLINQEVKDFITNNISDYYYGLSVDKHIFIDGKFELGIECKAYTENAMIKRILVDFYLLKTLFPKLDCYLFQLESQLGGDYSSKAISPLGSKSSHAIMSYFPTVELNILTLLPGERKIEEPINKIEHFKPLSIERLEPALFSIVNGLSVK